MTEDRFLVRPSLSIISIIFDVSRTARMGLQDRSSMYALGTLFGTLSVGDSPLAAPRMSGSLETFSRHINNVLQAQQAHILQALNVHSCDIHQKLSAIHCDVESLRNETLSQQNAFRSAFDIVAARLDEIQQISQAPRPTPLAITAAPHKGAMEDHRVLLDAINTRMESTENRLGKTMGDVAKKVMMVEHNVAEIFETVKNPRATCTLN